MFHVQKISSFDAPELQPYATMRRPLEHERQGIFVAEGTKVVRRLLESQFTVVSVVLPDKVAGRFPTVARSATGVHHGLSRGKETTRNPDRFLDVSRGAGCRQNPTTGCAGRHSGEKSKAASLRGGGCTHECGESWGVGTELRRVWRPGLFVGETSSSPFLRRAVRNSMGTIFQLPVIELSKLGQRHQFTTKPHATSQTLTECLKAQQRRGVRCIAAHPHTDKILLAQADFTGDCCLVFGSEGDGISPMVLETCDEAVAIPMPPAVDSLNVGASAAVFLYEVTRQRKKL